MLTSCSILNWFELVQSNAQQQASWSTRSFYHSIKYILIKFCIIIIIIIIIILLAFTAHLRVLASSFLRFRDHTQGQSTVGRTPLDEWSAPRRDLFLTNTQHSKQTNIHALGGIRTRNPSRRAAADPRLRALGHWDRQNSVLELWSITGGQVYFWFRSVQNNTTRKHKAEIRLHNFFFKVSSL
jgi:hypothetical protein